MYYFDCYFWIVSCLLLLLLHCFLTSHTKGFDVYAPMDSTNIHTHTIKRNRQTDEVHIHENDSFAKSRKMKHQNWQIYDWTGQCTILQRQHECACAHAYPSWCILELLISFFLSLSFYIILDDRNITQL